MPAGRPPLPRPSMNLTGQTPSLNAPPRLSRASRPSTPSRRNPAVNWRKPATPWPAPEPLSRPVMGFGQRGPTPSRGLPWTSPCSRRFRGRSSTHPRQAGNGRLKGTCSSTSRTWVNSTWRSGCRKPTFPGSGPTPGPRCRRRGQRRRPPGEHPARVHHRPPQPDGGGQPGYAHPHADGGS